MLILIFLSLLIYFSGKELRNYRVVAEHCKLLRVDIVKKLSYYSCNDVEVIFDKLPEDKFYKELIK